MRCLFALLLAPGIALALNRCCPPGQALQGERGGWRCGAAAGGQELLAPRHGGPLPPLLERPAGCTPATEVDRPTQDRRVLCLDVRLDRHHHHPRATLAALTCDDGDDRHQLFAVPEVASLRKCCPASRRYAGFRSGCEGAERRNGSDALQLLRELFLTGPAADHVVLLDIGPPPCPKGTVLSDFHLSHRLVWRQESESVLLRRGSGANLSGADLLVVPEEVCVDLTPHDDYTLVVRACQDARVTCDLKRRPCVNKCCPLGSSLRGADCVAGPDDDGGGFDVTLYSLSPPATTHRHQPSPQPTPVAPRSLGIAAGSASGFSCLNGRYPLDPAKFASDRFLVTDSGALLVPANPPHLRLMGRDQFCLERLGSRVLPILCFPFSSHRQQDDRQVVHFRPIAFGLLASAGFLLLTLLVYACLPALHNLHGLTLMSHVTALLVAYLCLASDQLFSDVIPPPLCRALGFAVQFFFLAAFAWLNVICFDIWSTFGAVQSAVALKGECRRRFLCYSLYAWLLPLAVTGLTLLVDSLHVVPDNFLPNMGSRYCWFAKDTHGLAVFFNLPVMVQVTTNLAFFALTVRNCSRIRTELRQLQGRASDDHRRADLKYRADLNKLVMNTKLCIVMGVTWGCEVVTWYFQLGSNSYWWYLLDAANILQGFFIFLIFVIKKKVLRAISGRARAVVPRRHQPSTSSTVFTTATSDSARAHTHKHA